MPVMPPWSDAAASLIDVATGRKPADTVVRGGRWVNVHSGEIVPGTDVAIVAGRFAYVGPDASHAIGDATRVIEADGRYLVPGADRRPHARRERHGHRHRVRPRRRPARHDDDVRRPARDRQRARPAGCSPDARRGGGAPGQRLRADAELRAVGARSRERGRDPRRRRGARGDGVAERRRSRRGHELPRRRGGGPDDARGDRGHPGGGGRPSAGTTRRSISGCRSRATSPEARPTITRARAPRTRSRACVRACARCSGSARPGTTSPRS